MLRSWRFLPSRLIVVGLISLTGLVISGCTNATTSANQPTTPPIASPPPSSQPRPPVNPAAPEQLGLAENMPYREARSHLIKEGWQPNKQGGSPNLQNALVKELFDLGYEEVKDCAGTGLGPCRFEFTNAAGQLLVVSAITNGGSNQERVVWRWFIEEKTNSGQSSSYETNNAEEAFSTKTFPIVEGLYVIGGTDQGLEVAGDQYRYYDELGVKEWRPLSELTPIKEGLVFDGQVYWCIPTERSPGVCTEHGWTPANLTDESGEVS